MKPIDTYRDAFLMMLKQGKTPLEALREFDIQEWRAALIAELESGECRINPETFAFEAHDGLPALLSLSGRAEREEANERDMEKAVELWFAGWTSEKPYPNRQIDVMSWFWRRPPIGKRTQGKLFKSTDQAYRAMRKSTRE